MAKELYIKGHTVLVDDDGRAKLVFGQFARLNFPENGET